MGTSFIESLYAIGDALSGAFMRIIGGRRSDGTAQSFLTDARGSMFVDVPGHLADPFNRIRVSEPVGVWEAKQNFDNSPQFFGTTLVGGGTATYVLNESSTNMTLTTASGDSVVRQSLQYMPYQPGKGQLILITGVMGIIKANVRQRIGYFDANNGVFFEQDGTDLKVVRRTFVSGSAVDTAVAQSAWNIDKFDGTGVSGITLDNSMIQNFAIDLTWLGSGSIRLGFFINGKIQYCHQIDTANQLTTVWATTAALPVRWEITNTGTAASGTTMKQVAAAVLSEGGNDPVGLAGAAVNTVAPLFNPIPVANNTSVPIISVRFKSAFSRATLIPTAFSVTVTNNNSYLVEVYIGGTLSGGTPVTTSVTDAVEMITGNTTFTGGRRIAAATGDNVNRTINGLITPGRRVCADATGTPELLTVVVTAVTANSSYYGSLKWRELY